MRTFLVETKDSRIRGRGVVTNLLLLDCLQTLSMTSFLGSAQRSISGMPAKDPKVSLLQVMLLVVTLDQLPSCPLNTRLTEADHQADEVEAAWFIQSWHD